MPLAGCKEAGMGTRVVKMAASRLRWTRGTDPLDLGLTRDSWQLTGKESLLELDLSPDSLEGLCSCLPFLCLPSLLCCPEDLMGDPEAVWTGGLESEASRQTCAIFPDSKRLGVPSGTLPERSGIAVVQQDLLVRGSRPLIKCCLQRRGGRGSHCTH